MRVFPGDPTQGQGFDTLSVARDGFRHREGFRGVARLVEWFLKLILYQLITVKVITTNQSNNPP